MGLSNAVTFKYLISWLPKVERACLNDLLISAFDEILQIGFHEMFGTSQNECIYTKMFVFYLSTRIQHVE